MRSRLFRFGLIIFALAVLVLLVFPTDAATIRAILAEKQWQAQQVRDYRIQVNITGAWMQMRVDTTVEDGQIVREICTTDGTAKPCNFTPDYNYSVPGLFTLARVGSPLASRDVVPASVATCLTITFDPALHYPRDMQHDCPAGADDEWSVHVQSFERIK
jgi:hypothetical protein